MKSVVFAFAALPLRMLAADGTSYPVLLQHSVIEVPASLPSQLPVKISIPSRFKPCEAHMKMVPSVDSVMDVFGGDDGLRAALACEKIEVGVLRHVEFGDSNTFEVPDGEWKTLEPADVTALRNVLTADSSYDWQADDDFFERHDVRVRFHCGDRTLLVDVDLTSETVCRVIAGDVIGRSIEPRFSEVLQLAFKYLFRDPKVSRAFSEWLTSR